jgi:hypothetical protein
MLKHIQAVRRLPGLRDATAVVIVESDTIHVAENMRRGLERSGAPRIVVMCEDRKRARGANANMAAEVRAGARTGSQNTPEMVNAAVQLFQLRAVRFHAQFVVAQPDQQPLEEPHPRERVTQQLANFKREVCFPTSRRNVVYTRPVLKYGARRPDGSPERTDFVMALLFSMFMYEVWCISPAYMGYR